MDEQIRIELMDFISKELKHRKMSNTVAAKLLGTNQSRISAMNTKRTQYPFSYEFLFSHISKLGVDVEIVTRKSKNEVGSIKLIPGI